MPSDADAARTAAADERFGGGALSGALRTADFWRRATGIYGAYKARQAQASLLRKLGWSSQRLQDELWGPHHEWAGREMYEMAVSLRGFYLKVGQFIAARSEFVPEPVCRELSKLHDRVPPMPTAVARRVLARELGDAPLGDVFAWIDLERPLGSASVAQVHKAQLRGVPARRSRVGRALRSRLSPVGFWLRRGEKRAAPPPGAEVLECTPGLEAADPAALPSAVRAARAAAADPRGPAPDGLVAVKIQYPGAAATMADDLRHVRVWARILSKNEIAFDMLSAVDELNAQVALEFDFGREARVMDTVAGHLESIRGEVEVPRSVPGLVTPRLLVMGFVEGEQITRLKSKVARMSKLRRTAAARLILSRVARAYGVMILGEGLFQADSHPGNILVQRGGRVALLDYGQSKQLPEKDRLAFAALVAAMACGYNSCDKAGVARALTTLGLAFSKDDPDTIAKMAYGMFDTRTAYKVDPFAADSPIKQISIETFPPDVFFVLRVTQMLRGLAGGMGVHDFSVTSQWAPYARGALDAHYRALPLAGNPAADATAPHGLADVVALEGGGEELGGGKGGASGGKGVAGGGGAAGVEDALGLRPVDAADRGAGGGRGGAQLH